MSAQAVPVPAAVRARVQVPLAFAAGYRTTVEATCTDLVDDREPLALQRRVLPVAA
jgi:hypothetical protein